MISAYIIAKKVRRIWNIPDKEYRDTLVLIEDAIIKASDEGKVTVNCSISNKINILAIKKALEKEGYVVAHSESGNMYTLGIGWEYLI